MEISKILNVTSSNSKKVIRVVFMPEEEEEIRKCFKRGFNHDIEKPDGW